MPLQAVSSRSRAFPSAGASGATRDERELGRMRGWFAAIRNRAVRLLGILPGRAKLKPLDSRRWKKRSTSPAAKCDCIIGAQQCPPVSGVCLGPVSRPGYRGWMPKTNLPPGRHALRLLVRNRDGCTTTMLSAREVKVEPIEELIAVGFAIKKSDLVHSRKDPTLGRGRRPITRIAITDAGRLALPTIMT